ncbi:hypothetical protein V1477_010359 [Vespula maculifrons]|uniref:Uncharacterized protein n=1 Tax=Vespula maculifrons TaxID=7453 RepID=A0ABD2C8D3_VESMC
MVLGKSCLSTENVHFTHMDKLAKVVGRVSQFDELEYLMVYLYRCSIKFDPEHTLKRDESDDLESSEDLDPQFPCSTNAFFEKFRFQNCKRSKEKRKKKQKKKKKKKIVAFYF